MRRRILLALCLLILCSPALGEEDGTAPAAMSLRPSDDGFVRLDTETGAISHCSKRDEVWHCDVLVEDPVAATARIDALAAEVKALTEKVDALAAEVEAAEPEGPGVVALTPEDEKQIDRAMGFSEILMRRFFSLVRAMKEEAAGGG